MKVRFLESTSPYTKGEVADIDDHIAKELIKRRMAESFKEVIRNTSIGPRNPGRRKPVTK